MELRPIYAFQLINEFDLKITNYDLVDLNRVVRGAAINRAGLELQGAHNDHQKSHIIGWGSKESQWFEKIGASKSILAMKNVLSSLTPLIILSSGVTPNIIELITKVANEFQIPICETNDHLSASISTLGSYLGAYFAPSEDVHGSLVVVNGVGVMIVGKSGIGKSEAVLELLQNGHFFVSDDTIVLKRVGKQFIGEPAKITKGLLEARGIGLIDIAHVYGVKVIKDTTPIDLVLELLVQNRDTSFDRLGLEILEFEALHSTIPKMQIPVFQGRSLAVLIEAAVNVYLAKKAGLNPLAKIDKRRGEF